MSISMGLPGRKLPNANVISLKKKKRKVAYSSWPGVPQILIVRVLSKYYPSRDEAIHLLSTRGLELTSAPHLHTRVRATRPS